MRLFWDSLSLLFLFVSTALGVERLRSGYFSNKENSRRLKVTHPYGALTVQFRGEKKKLLDQKFDIITGNLTSFAISARSKSGRSEKFIFSIVSDRKLKVSVLGKRGTEIWHHRPFAKGAIDDALLLESELSMLSEAQRHVLADFTAGKRTKRNAELVIAAYNENITWAHMYSHLTTVYVKGELVYVPVNGSQLSRVVPLPNVGRETHTYLTHIVRNYDSLADVTVFTQGESPTQGYEGHRKGGGHMYCDVTLHDYILGNASLFFMTEMLHMRNAFHVVRKGYNGGTCLRKRSSTSPIPEEITSSAKLPHKCFGDNDTEAFILPSRHHPVTVHIMGDTCKRDHEDACTLYAFWDKYIRLPRPKEGLVWYAQGAVFAASKEDIRRRSRTDYQRLLKVASLGQDTSTGFFMEYFWHALVTSEPHACGQGVFSTEKITREALAAPAENALSFAELSDILRSREKNETAESAQSLESHHHSGKGEDQGQGQDQIESSQLSF